MLCRTPLLFNEDVSSTIRRQSGRTVARIGTPATSIHGLKPPWLKQHFKERRLASKEDRPSRFASSFDQSLAHAQGVAASKHGLHAGERLGAGQSGATFTHATHPGTIIKFDKGDREAKLARYVAATKDLKTGSILPRYHKVVDTGVRDEETGENIHAIHREDLADLKTKDHAPWHAYGRMVSDTAERVANESGKSQDFHALRQEIDAHHRNVRGHVQQAERQRFDRFHRGVQQLLRHGIIPCDLHAGNLGSRPNGDVVVRDAGCHHRVQFQ